MKNADVWRERVAGMASDELAAVLTVDARRYHGEVLELARKELRHRGFIVRGSSRGGVITSADGVMLRPRPAPARPAPDPGPKGVGGWLLIFILGQLLCRPLSHMEELTRSSLAIAQLSDKFPLMASVLEVEKALSFGLMLFGLIVGTALFGKGSSLPVRLAKIDLVAGPLAHVFIAVLCSFTDFPEDYREHVTQQYMWQAVRTSLWSLVWTLYFSRSQRVKATYLSGGPPAIGKTPAA